MKAHLHMPEIRFGAYRLRTIKVSDWMDMFEYGSDPVVTEHLNWGPFERPEDAKRAIKGIFLPRPTKGLPVGYAIEDTFNKKMIGTIDIHSPSRDNRSVEIGFVLHRAYWNKGIMTEALTRLLEVVFGHLGYRTVRIRHLVNNEASARVIMKAGFNYVSTEPFVIEKQGVRMTGQVRVYTLDKEEYHGHKQSQRNI
jgi:[ribosomal protein S5]-alanine N-acetyltransferase